MIIRKKRWKMKKLIKILLILIIPVAFLLKAQYEHISIKINPIIIFILNSWYIKAEKPETIMQKEIIKNTSIILINIIFINLFFIK